MSDPYRSVHAGRSNSGRIREGPRRTGGAFETVWSFETAGILETPPVVADERVFVADGTGTVYAVDAIDGRRLWRTELTVPTVVATPAVVDRSLFVSGYDDLDRSPETTYAIDPASGDVRWSRDFTQGGKTPLKADDERLYLRTVDGTVRALSRRTGDERWQVPLDGAGPTPTVADGTVILVDGRDVLGVAVDGGERLWRTTLPANVRTPPVVHDGRAYLTAGTADQFCLSSASGETLWHVDVEEAIRSDPGTCDPLLPVGGRALSGKPVTDGASVFLGLYDGIVELDASDGSVNGYSPLDCGRVYDPLLAADGTDRRLYGSVRNGGFSEFLVGPDGVTGGRSFDGAVTNTVQSFAAGVFYVSEEGGSVRAIA